MYRSTHVLFTSARIITTQQQPYNFTHRIHWLNLSYAYNILYMFLLFLVEVINIYGRSVIIVLFYLCLLYGRKSWALFSGWGLSILIFNEFLFKNPFTMISQIICFYWTSETVVFNFFPTSNLFPHFKPLMHFSIIVVNNILFSVFLPFHM